MQLTTPYEYRPLERTTRPIGRHYVVDTKRPLPSVTTILDKTSDKSFLEEWRNNVGHEEAERITNESANIGNTLHDNLEQHILHGSPPKGNLLTKLLTKLVIDKGLSNVDEVWGTEVPLYMPDLWAGTTDLVGIHDGTDAIMDFKNSRKDKKREWVEDYFLQLTAYGEAHNNMFGTNIKKGVVMMGCHSGKYLEFIIEGDEYDKYADMWYERVYKFYEMHGI